MSRMMETWQVAEKSDPIHENHTKQDEATRKSDVLIRVFRGISCHFVDRLHLLDRCSSFFSRLLEGTEIVSDSERVVRLVSFNSDQRAYPCEPYASY